MGINIPEWATKYNTQLSDLGKTLLITPLNASTWIKKMDLVMAEKRAGLKFNRTSAETAEAGSDMALIPDRNNNAFADAIDTSISVMSALAAATATKYALAGARDVRYPPQHAYAETAEAGSDMALIPDRNDNAFADTIDTTISVVSALAAATATKYALASTRARYPPKLSGAPWYAATDYNEDMPAGAG